MRRSATILLLPSLLACSPRSDVGPVPSDGADGTEADPSGEASSVGGESDGTGESSGAADGSDEAATGAHEDDSGEDGGVVVQVDDTWIDRIEGRWLGPVDPTPMGPIPSFPLDFQREDDGSLHALSEGGGASFEFRFFQQGGQWLMAEEGKLGPLTQSATLHPIDADGASVRFAMLDRPGYLEVEVTVDETALVMVVDVRGRQHAVFNLARQ